MSDFDIHSKTLILYCQGPNVFTNGMLSATNRILKKFGETQTRY